MARAYSQDLRERAVKYVESGGAYKEASALFGVCEKTISEWRQRKQEKGHLLPEKAGRKGERKIDYDGLKKYVDENNDRTLEELGKEFSATPSGIHKALEKMEITYKKKRRFTPSVTKKSGPPS